MIIKRRKTRLGYVTNTLHTRVRCYLAEHQGDLFDKISGGVYIGSRSVLEYACGMLVLHRDIYDVKHTGPYKFHIDRDYVGSLQENNRIITTVTPCVSINGHLTDIEIKVIYIAAKSEGTQNFYRMITLYTKDSAIPPNDITLEILEGLTYLNWTKYMAEDLIEYVPAEKQTTYYYAKRGCKGDCLCLRKRIMKS